jgi:hypothetical protein
MEFPSTKAAITCARFTVLSRFMLFVPYRLYTSIITANVKLYFASIKIFNAFFNAYGKLENAENRHDDGADNYGDQEFDEDNQILCTLIFKIYDRSADTTRANANP